MIKHKNVQIIESEPTQTHANYIIHMLLGSMLNHFSLSTMDFEANRTCENRRTPETVWSGRERDREREMNQKEFRWIRFMEASYPVVRFATYRSMSRFAWLITDLETACLNCSLFRCRCAEKTRELNRC